MSNTWDCEYYIRCKNNTRCLSCGPDQRFLELPEDKERKKYRSQATQNTITLMNDNTGQTLEDYVAANFNNLPTVKEWSARRQAGSGNIWFMPGDVADSVILAECKERSTTTSKGEKSISIPRTMLEKIDEESSMSRTYPALVFRYKGDETGKTYFIQDFDTLCQMVHEIKLLRHENKIIYQERDMWKQVNTELHDEIRRLKQELGEK